MQGKQLISAFFRENGISCIFQLPGLHTLSLNAELFVSKTLKIITARHETSCAFMADGYARASGKPAVLLVTPGPGLGNIVTGCMEAYSDDVPLFILHVDTDRRDIGKGALHEIENPENIFRYFTKGIFKVDEASHVRSALDGALGRCTEGRPGPVLVSIPFSFLDREIPDTPHGPPRPPGQASYAGLDEFLNDCRDILAHKVRPVLVGGRGLMHPRAGDIVEEICARGVPFLTTTGGKGVISDRAVFSFGNIIAKGVARDILDRADLVIAAGTRLREADTKKRGLRMRELIHIDTDERWIGKNYPCTAHFEGNVELALEGLSGTMRDRVFEWDLAFLDGKRNAERNALQSQTGHAVINLIRNASPSNTIFACDLNLPSYWAEYYLPVYSPRSFLMPRGISPIFYSLSAAIGAKLARPAAPCLALCGDGGLLPQTAELATIVKYKVPVVIFVDNNMSYGILEEAMRSRYGIDGSMRLENPDFVKLAASYGIPAASADTLDGLRTIFREKVAWDEPFLIEFKDTDNTPPWE